MGSLTHLFESNKSPTLHATVAWARRNTTSHTHHVLRLKEHGFLMRRMLRDSFISFSPRFISVLVIFFFDYIVMFRIWLTLSSGAAQYKMCMHFRFFSFLEFSDTFCCKKKKKEKERKKIKSYIVYIYIGNISNLILLWSKCKSASSQLDVSKTHVLLTWCWRSVSGDVSDCRRL